MGRKLEKPYLRLTREINRAMTQRYFTPFEACVMNAIIGSTFGKWDAKAKEAMDRNEFTLDGLAADTGLFKGRVHEALKSLIADNIVIEYRKGRPRVPAILGIQDHTELWTRPTNSENKVRNHGPKTQSATTDS